MRGFITVLTASLVVPLSTLSAQQSAPVQVGNRIRVSQCHRESTSSGRQTDVCERKVGTLLMISMDSIAVATPAGRLAFGVDSVTRLEVSRGRKGLTLAGLGIGFAVGAASGAILANKFGAGEGACYGGMGDPCPTLAAAAFGLAGGIGGILVGSLTGWAIKTDRWEEVPLDRLRVSFVPQRDGASFGLRIVF